MTATSALAELDRCLFAPLWKTHVWAVEASSHHIHFNGADLFGVYYNRENRSVGSCPASIDHRLTILAICPIFYNKLYYICCFK